MIKKMMLCVGVMLLSVGNVVLAEDVKTSKVFITLTEDGNKPVDVYESSNDGFKVRVKEDVSVFARNNMESENTVRVSEDKVNGFEEVSDNVFQRIDNSVDINLGVTYSSIINDSGYYNIENNQGVDYLFVSGP